MDNLSLISQHYISYFLMGKHNFPLLGYNTCPYINNSKYQLKTTNKIKLLNY